MAVVLVRVVLAEVIAVVVAVIFVIVVVVVVAVAVVVTPSIGHVSPHKSNCVKFMHFVSPVFLSHFTRLVEVYIYTDFTHLVEYANT